MMPQVFILILCLFPIGLNAQQLVDKHYQVKNTQDYFPNSNRPRVKIDAAHANFHTLEGKYQPFAKVLSNAGFQVSSNLKSIDRDLLKSTDILVIANALHPQNRRNWDLPNYPAFKRSEIEALFNWVKAGGSLMLIADHMPFPKAAEELAEIFGFHFSNSYVEILGSREQYFEISDNSLQSHAILTGMQGSQSISKVRGFMGQAFLSPPQAKPIMSFSKAAVAYMPKKSWGINDDTPTIPVQGWHQGASLELGKGRLLVFGEAGMFTAQVSGKEQWKMGLAAKGAEQNEQFLINSLLWLARKI
ncbi:hypothetical protein [uncultured Pseudoteredinibacter sp.]|uniref:hypothetical protein n=1 Tax=uncultured Pseudoteredinibacter sp. TaxID=1641701 RepID=UPI0026153657|nr:hypothetical protein [uncultured Pseudoteredinibacter sp.]